MFRHFHQLQSQCRRRLSVAHHTMHPNVNILFSHSYRFKRGAKGRKQAKESEYLDGGRPAKGTTLDTEDYRKRMQKHILKYQQSLREIQPKSANSSVVEEIEVNDCGNKVALKKVADVTMRGVSSIAILPHKPEKMQIIETALIEFSEEFNPRCDAKSGLIIVNVPKPNDEQLASLKFAVTNRRDSCKRQCQDLMKIAMNEAKKLSEYLPKDDVHQYNVALNELIQTESKKIDLLSEKKLKEFI